MVPTSLIHLASKQVTTVEELSGNRLGAFCGLAKPGSFFKSLHEMNVKLQAHLCLPDHARYDNSELYRLKQFQDLNRLDYLLTSEKDAVKLPQSINLPIITLESDLVLDRPNEFLEEILSRLF
jgi:tetraacyldisaccharide 4'-kinase